MSNSASRLPILFVVLLLALGGAYYLFKQQQPSSTQPKTGTPSTTTTVAPPKVTSVKGLVTQFTDTTIVIKSASASAAQTFSYSDTTGFYRVTSGNLDANTATIAKATSKNLQDGSEVIVTINELEPSKADTVLIVK